MRRALALCLLLVSLTALAEPLRVGAARGGAGDRARALEAATMAWLNGPTLPERVSLSYLSEDELAAESATGRLDLVIAEPPFLLAHAAELTALASERSALARPGAAIGGALYLVASDSPSAPLERRLESGVLLADEPGSWTDLIWRHDMSRRGLSRVSARYRPDGPGAAVDELLSGKVGAVVLPLCQFEELARRRPELSARLRALGLRDDGDQPCAASSARYPGRALAVRPGLPEELTRRLLAALMEMPELSGEGVSGWTIPADLASARELLSELDPDLGPAPSAAHSLLALTRQYRWHIVALALCAALIFGYAFIVSLVVRQRTTQLRAALRERDEIERRAAASRDLIDRLERTGVIGQMSTMIAHELKQPLGAIANYANGLQRRSRRGALTPNVLDHALGEIVRQGQRASEIVNRVRGYARRDSPKLLTRDLGQIVGRVCETFRRSRQTEAEILVRVAPPQWAEVDEWEIELALINLLKNAAEALRGRDAARVVVWVEAEDIYWRLSVSDNGAQLSDEDIARFTSPLVTGRDGGLGLGLSIVAGIAERHDGRFSGRANPNGGATFSLDIPRAGMPEHSAL